MDGCLMDRRDGRLHGEERAAIPSDAGARVVPERLG